jgi:hypothetical protein
MPLALLLILVGLLLWLLTHGVLSTLGIVLLVVGVVLLVYDLAVAGPRRRAP